MKFEDVEITSITPVTQPDGSRAYRIGYVKKKAAPRAAEKARTSAHRIARCPKAIAGTLVRWAKALWGHNLARAAAMGTAAALLMNVALAIARATT